MTIRKATKEDIPFIVNAIMEIERFFDTDTFSNLFGSEHEETKSYLEAFFGDIENFDTELSLNSYAIAQIDNRIVGCCSLIFTNKNYYQNKAELFPVHLNQKHLENFIQNVKTLPEIKTISENKHFIEYIYTIPNYRGQGVAKKMIDFQLDILKNKDVYINVLENNTSAINYYKNLGFKDFQTILIDNLDHRIFPSPRKLVLVKKYH